MSETWRDVAGYEGIYEVSDCGNVRSLNRNVIDHRGVTRHYRGRMISPATSADGYPIVSLWYAGAHKTRTVHGLVAAAFLSKRTEGDEVCHNNGNPQDNRVTNLRWDSHSENVLDSVRQGTYQNNNAVKTHCPRGHEYDSENTNLYQGRRYCRACTKIRDDRKYLKRKAQSLLALRSSSAL